MVILCKILLLYVLLLLLSPTAINLQLMLLLDPPTKSHETRTSLTYATIRAVVISAVYHFEMITHYVPFPLAASLTCCCTITRLFVDSRF